jgi:hypothetical protein
MPMPTPSDLLAFLIPGYLTTILIEAPILLLCLSARHAIREKAIAGVMLTACTYPIVVLVLPELLWRPFGYVTYISLAETFAPLAEIVIFYFIWIRRLSGTARHVDTMRDFAAIVAANLASWLGGGLFIGWVAGVLQF